MTAISESFFHERADEIRNLARATAENIWRIGQILTEVKASKPHGEFLPWIEKEFGWSADTAERFMHVHARFKFRNLRNIQPSALYVLAKTPEAVREDAVARAEAGETVTHEGAQALKESYSHTGRVSTAGLATMIEQARQERKAEKKAKAEYDYVPEDEEEAPTPVKRKTGAERAAEKEREARLDAGDALAMKFFEIIESLERLSTTTLTVAEIAEQIRRFDNPNTDWRGHLTRARQNLAALAGELNAPQEQEGTVRTDKDGLRNKKSRRKQARRLSGRINSARV
ncbi:MAG TPA: DUF3102 domain-containing protein [Bryobacteraceae bacterium]|nr:DUF3102 domain-containing protein [Bryobacteraceae bacterium]